MITLNNIFVKSFSKTILKDINLSIKKGNIISVIGQNGAGKSTLCKLLVGAIKPSNGKILKQKNVRISYVPQIIERSILLPITVKDFLFLGQNDITQLDFKTHFLDLKKFLNLDELLHNNLNTLSGGEMQKVLLTRALLRKPDLLILDEAFSFLDLSTLFNLYNITFNEQKKLGFAMILISHDINFVIKKTNYILCLNKGSVHCYGNYNDIKEITYIKDLVGKYIHKTTNNLA